jgi:hypothetical protein
VERFLYPAEDRQWTLQLALSEPITSTIDPAFRLIEDNGWPNIEGRIAWSLGPLQVAGLSARRPVEMGVSGVVGQIRTTLPTVDNLVFDRVVADVWGLSGDFRWQIHPAFGVMGEVYTGQSLGTYNAGILQTINTGTLRSVRSSGGWLEAFLYWTPQLHTHAGYALDDPVARDLETGVFSLARTRNSTLYGNVIWDLNATFRVAFEFAWRETDYLFPGVPDNAGAGFHTQFQWAF